MTDHKETWYLKRNAEYLKLLTQIRDVVEDPDISYPVTVQKISDILEKVIFEPSLSVVK